MEKDSIITKIHSVQGYPTINVWLSGKLTVPGEGNTHKPLTDPNAIYGKCTSKRRSRT